MLGTQPRSVDNRGAVCRANGRWARRNTRNQVILLGPGRSEQMVGHPDKPTLDVDDIRGYRVRLNGADHQWGKDPPKEVVG